MRKMTLQDLEALAKLETAIKELPETGDPVILPEPLTMSREYHDAVAKIEHEEESDFGDEDDECGGGDGIIITSCRGQKQMCAKHGMELIKDINEEIEKRKRGEDLEPCPNGCGNDAVLCWRIIGFSPEFVLRHILPNGRLP